MSHFELFTDAAPARARVLCLDEQPQVLRSLRWLLQSRFEVHTCERVSEALKLLRAHDFDVVMSDQRIRGITGVEFLRHVGRLAPRASRILLTDYAELDEVSRSAAAAQGCRFVGKPWDADTLPQLVGRAAQAARDA
ncbi:MAG TPA: response regulator [Usitatibacter sp.]|nr:response regulator [Usitatibacter sp.]